MRGKEQWVVAILLLISIFMLIGWDEQGRAAEKYPTRAIEVIVPFSAGGGTDTAARVYAAYLKEKWGVPVNVVNKPGGKCVPATLEVYKARPDGYTMLADSQAGCPMVAAQVKNLPFEIMDRTFIATISTSPYMLMVPSASPFKTVEDFVAEAKKTPENVSWTGGSAGIEYFMRKFFSLIDVDTSKMKVVMCRGGSEATALTAGGHVTIGASVKSSIHPAIKAGTVRALAITTKKRDPDLQNVPTTGELGYPTLDTTAWVGISGPPKLPPHIVDVWGRILREMVRDPKFISHLNNIGAIPYYFDSQTTRRVVKEEIEEATRLLTK